MERIFQKINRFFYGKWHIAVLDLERGRWTNDPNIRYIPYFKAENANGRHILIQPLKDIACFYMLVDDINWSFILKHHIHSDGKWKPGRMVVETSPGNYQVWIHSEQSLSTDDKLYWLKKLDSDPGAHPDNRWGRCPGFRNRKAIYRNSQNQYPLSKLVWVDWKYLANVPKPLSTQPWGGCVKIVTFPAWITSKMIHQPLTFHLFWLYSEQDILNNKLSSESLWNVLIFVITREKKEKSNILKERLNALKKLSIIRRPYDSSDK